MRRARRRLGEVFHRGNRRVLRESSIEFVRSPRRPFRRSTPAADRSTPSSVRSSSNSIWNSNWNSIWNSNWNSIWNSIWKWCSIWNSALQKLLPRESMGIRCRVWRFPRFWRRRGGGRRPMSCRRGRGAIDAISSALEPSTVHARAFRSENRGTVGGSGAFRGVSRAGERRRSEA